MNSARDLKLSSVINLHKTAFREEPYPSLNERQHNLQTLKRLLLENQSKIIQAFNEDFSSRSKDEITLIEIVASVQGINFSLKNLKKWMRPEKRHVAWFMLPGKAKVIHQPLGVVGVMAAWNYPVYLATAGISTALAAGNQVVVKMPETTPAISALYSQLIEQYFPNGPISIVNGDASVSKAFSAQPWDHLLFTGSSAVGSQVMAAAAKNLTPVTLELGGKSPVIIHDSANIRVAAEKVCYGKSLNSSQTCIAPDYVFVPASKVSDFIESYKASFNKFYRQLDGNEQYTSIVNAHHYERLQSLLEQAKAKGAEVHIVSDETIRDGSNKFPPVLLSRTNDTMLVMQQEIFGPILPVIAYDSLDQVIEYINDRGRPLALYLFSNNKDSIQKITTQTHSGGMCVNDTLFHALVEDMPFGGVGPSGMGHYHGKEGFLTFSKSKPILYKPEFNTSKLMYPPYREIISRLLRWLLLR